MTALALRLLATTDLHAHLGAGDRADGLARLAPMIAAARAEAEGPCLLFDCGDGLQGAPLAEWAAQQANGPHPVVAAMNALAYDAATLGNHDFDFGLAAVHRALADAEFPVVVSNLEGEPLGTVSTAMLDVPGSPLRLGVLGLLPPQTMAWNARHLVGRVAIHDMVGAAERAAQSLRAAGADLVVGLAHTGFGATRRRKDMENALHPLRRVAAVDVWFGGHTHEVHARQSEGRARPVVMAGSLGSHLGIVDMRLRKHGRGWRIVETVCTAMPAGDAATPEALGPEVAAAERATARMTSAPVGETAVPLHTHFARFAPSRALDLIAEAQVAHATERLAGGPWADTPVIAAVSPFRAGVPGDPDAVTHIDPGALTWADLFDLYPYANAFTAVLASGRDLRGWIARASAQFRTVRAGAQDVALIDETVPSFAYDVLWGLQAELDLGAEPGTDARVVRLTYRGAPVADSARFVVATNSYRAAGGSGFVPVPEARRILEDPLSCRDALVAYVRAGARVEGSAQRWVSFRPKGATALVAAGRRSAALAAEAAALGLSPAGQAEDGAALWRLSV